MGGRKSIVHQEPPQAHVSTHLQFFLAGLFGSVAFTVTVTCTQSQAKQSPEILQACSDCRGFCRWSSFCCKNSPCVSCSLSPVVSILPRSSISWQFSTIRLTRTQSASSLRRLRSLRQVQRRGPLAVNRSDRVGPGSRLLSGEIDIARQDNTVGFHRFLEDRRWLGPRSSIFSKEERGGRLLV